MSLRTTALVAGVIGVLLLAAGLVAESQRPPRDVTASASVDTAVVVYEAEMIAFAGDFRIGASADGSIVAVTARPSDAEAWLADRDATRVTGLPTWETLSTDSIEAPEPTASPSPSASEEPAEESAEESAAEPSPSPSPSGDEESADAEPVSILAESSEDHWRADWRGQGRLSIRASDVPPGETLLIVSEDGSEISDTDLALTRDVDDGWITPLIWWGAFLVAVGLIALVLRFIDLRPAQARGEEWIAKRQRTGDEDEGLKPSSRRARRAKGEHLPEANLDEDPAPASAGDPANPPSPAGGEAPPAADAGADADPHDQGQPGEERR